MDKPIVFFDGVCNFCNFWVKFILKRDKKQALSFASLQGKTAEKLLPEFGINPTIISTIIFIENGKAYTESSAAMRISRYLGNGWKLFGILYIIPKFIRDGMYKWIAANRYKWFGKKDSCMIPSAEIRSRFLD